MSNKRNYQTEIEDLLRRSTNDTIREILSAIYNERDQMTKLLDNGVPVFETAYGERLYRLLAQRRKLWLKVAEIDKCTSIILKHFK